MRRLVSFLTNIVGVGGLLIGAAFLLLNFVFSPAWKDLDTGLFATNPVRWILYAENSPLNQSRVIETVRLWARLAPLPRSTHDLIVDSSGEVFDKRYIVTFKALPRDIDAWLAASAGTAQQVSQPSPVGDRHYSIQPRDAAFAEVTVLADQQTVKIKAFWSDSPSSEVLKFPARKN